MLQMGRGGGRILVLPLRTSLRLNGKLGLGNEVAS